MAGAFHEVLARAFRDDDDGVLARGDAVVERLEQAARAVEIEAAPRGSGRS